MTYDFYVYRTGDKTRVQSETKYDKYGMFIIVRPQVGCEEFR
jgi:hypothetical protein